jgi:hypothetical protein
VDIWVNEWLSEPRFKTYSDATGGDEGRAFDLYVWNGRLAASILRDLGDLEVLIRNRFNRAVADHRPGPHWLLDPQSPIRVEKLRRSRSGELRDANRTTRDKVEQAIREAGGPNATPGKVIAELMFGFWLAMTRRALETEMWTPYFSRAFLRPRPERRAVEARMQKLNELRNRVAHHEHLLRTDVAQHHASLLELAGWLSPAVRDHIGVTSDVPALLATRP